MGVNEETLDISPFFEEKPDRDIDCDGCTKCCEGTFTLLYEDDGDDISEYKTAEVTPGQFRLATRHNGNCLYLGPEGCTIYDRRPAMCRGFDCISLIEDTSHEQRQLLLKQGAITKAVMDEGINRERELRKGAE